MPPSKNRWGHPVHQYMRVENRNGTKIWRCMLPNCRHYLVDKMVLGQMCLCNRCEAIEFVLEPHHLDLKRPHCLNCTRIYNTKGVKKGASTIQNILENLDELLDLK